MKQDARGLALSTDSDAAARALDAVVGAYLGYRTDAMQHVDRMLEADPGFALGDIVKGYLMLLLSNRAYLPLAAEALARAGFAHHLWWHLALHRIEQGRDDEALRLYDRDIRNLASPLVASQADLYLDMQNAAALLWRLELIGLDVGDRWLELADKSEARIGDHVLLFTVPHFMMALAATGRRAAAERMLAELRAFTAEDSGTLAPIVAAVCLPACEALLAHRSGAFERTVELLAPVRRQLWRLGGSQRDVFQQTLVDACLRCGRTGEARGFLREALAAGSASLPRRFYAAAAARGRSASP